MKSSVAATRQAHTSRSGSAAPPAAGVPQRVHVHVHAAANDAAAKSFLENFKDPLWMLAIAMGVFFGLVALFVALG